MTNKTLYAIAVFSDTIKGTVKFSEDLTNNKIKIDLNISGLSPNSLHGFHVHESGDLTDKCASMCSHFNPYGNTHGCPSMSKRHVGDLGNIKTNNKGEAKYTFYDNNTSHGNYIYVDTFDLALEKHIFNYVIDLNKGEEHHKKEFGKVKQQYKQKYGDKKHYFINNIPGAKEHLDNNNIDLSLFHKRETEVNSKHNNSFLRQQQSMRFNNYLNFRKPR